MVTGRRRSGRDRRCAPYDPAVDPNTARHVLRLSPDAPLTPSTIEAAFASESCHYVDPYNSKWVCRDGAGSVGGS